MTILIATKVTEMFVALVCVFLDSNNFMELRQKIARHNRALDKVHTRMREK